MTLVCKLCGSNAFEKEGDFYVCQSCGTKITKDMAVKLSGSVTINQDPQFENLMQLARRARSDGNNKEAEGYYSRAAEINPDNWEAAVFGTGISPNSLLPLILKEDTDEQRRAFRECVVRYTKYTGSIDKSFVPFTDKSYISFVDKTLELFPEEKETALNFYKSAFEEIIYYGGNIYRDDGEKYHKSEIHKLKLSELNIIKDRILKNEELLNKIKALEPSYSEADKVDEIITEKTNQEEELKRQKEKEQNKDVKKSSAGTVFAILGIALFMLIMFLIGNSCGNSLSSCLR